MNKQLYIVYETDAWHTVCNRTPMGIFSSKTMAINTIVKFHNIPLEEIISNNDLQKLTSKEIHKEIRKLLREELESVLQTQGYSVNYDIVICSQNEWGEI